MLNLKLVSERLCAVSHVREHIMAETCFQNIQLNPLRVLAV